MSNEGPSGESNWSSFDKLLLEASKLSLSREHSYRRKSVESYESLEQFGSSIQSVPGLSRNSTLSSTSTQNSHDSFQPLNSFQVSKDNGVHKPHALSDCSLPTGVDLLTRRNQVSLGPEGCFVSCKEKHLNPNINAQYHFITPIFALTGKRFANILFTLFNYNEPDPFTPKKDYEKTITWKANDSSLLTLSQYTYQPNDKSSWRHLSDTIGQQIGITSLIVAAHTIKELYTLLDHLVHSIDQANTSTCSWWTRVILVLDEYQERSLFLSDEMRKIMARYQLSQPLSVLFIHTSSRKVDKTQAMLRQMMIRHLDCGRWTSYCPQEDSDSSFSDSMYTMATIIEYKDGKRKRPPKNEKLNCYPGDDGSTL